MSLTIKQELFINGYLKYRNASKAAELAGYSPNGKNYQQIGSENLSKLVISNEIENRLNEKALRANEVIARLSDMAMGDLALVADVKSQDDLINHPYSHLVKKIKTKTRTFINTDGGIETETEVDLELHDPKSALDSLGKYWALFTDKIKQDVNVESTLVILPSKE